MGSRSRARLTLLAAVALALVAPSFAYGQGKDAFVQALIQFSRAAAGTDGDEADALRASLNGMTAGLAAWDQAVGRVEAGFKGAIGTASGVQAVQMRATLAATYLERGRAREALTILDGSPSGEPVPPAFHLVRAAAQERLGDARGASQSYRRAFTGDPTGYLAAYPFLRSTRDGDAEGRQPASDALVQAAVAAASGQQGAGVSFLDFDLLDESSAEAPLFPMSAYADGAALLAAARFDEAAARFTTAALEDPLVTDAARTHEGARAAAEALAQSNGQAAVAAALRVPMGDRSTEVQRLLGLAFWTLGDYDKSLGHLRAAVRLNPANERARLALADVLVAAGRADEARASLTETTQTLPRSGQAWWRLARLALDRGDEYGARQAYEEAARTAPIVGASLVHGALGRLRHNALDLDGAARAHGARVAAETTSVAAHVDLGRVFVAQDRLEEAAAEFAVAVLLDARHADALVALGQLRSDTGDDAGALALLKAATSADPRHGEARYALSRVLRRSGQDAAADAELAAFQRLQREALDTQRRRFDQNSQALEKALQGRPQ